MLKKAKFHIIMVLPKRKANLFYFGGEDWELIRTVIARLYEFLTKSY